MPAATVSRLTTTACATVFVSHTAYRLRIVFCLIASHGLLIISGSVHTISEGKEQSYVITIVVLHLYYDLSSPTAGYPPSCSLASYYIS